MKEWNLVVELTDSETMELMEMEGNMEWMEERNGGRMDGWKWKEVTSGVAEASLTIHQHQA